jgi:hypothetical protein
MSPESSMFNPGSRSTRRARILNIRFRHILVTVMLGAVVVMLPALNRTLYWASDAEGLILIAATNKSDLSLNPFYQDSYLVTPDMAVWLLERFNWPYSRNLNPSRPPLHEAIALRSMSTDTATHEDELRKLKVIAILIARGEPIDQYFHSYTPLLSSILHCDRETAVLLLDAGADPTLTVVKPGSIIDGLSSYEFAVHLREHDKYNVCSENILTLFADAKSAL